MFNNYKKKSRLKDNFKKFKFIVPASRIPYQIGKKEKERIGGKEKIKEVKRWEQSNVKFILRCRAVRRSGPFGRYFGVAVTNTHNLFTGRNPLTYAYGNRRKKAAKSGDQIGSFGSA